VYLVLSLRNFLNTRGRTTKSNLVNIHYSVYCYSFKVGQSMNSLIWCIMNTLEIEKDCINLSRAWKDTRFCKNMLFMR
jgi:hypothetical protein